jgi:hypothetical protein
MRYSLRSKKRMFADIAISDGEPYVYGADRVAWPSWKSRDLITLSGISHTKLLVLQTLYITNALTDRGSCIS